MTAIQARIRDRLLAAGRPDDGGGYGAALKAELEVRTRIVSRLDKFQKGFGRLIGSGHTSRTTPSSRSVLEAILDDGVRIVIHGPTMPGCEDFVNIIQRLSRDPRYRGQVALINDFGPAIKNTARAAKIQYDHPLLYQKDLVFTVDGFLIPSLEEPFGLTMLEALREGTPVIASTNGGPLDILGNHDARVHRDGMGFLYGPLWAHRDDPAYQALAAHLRPYTAQGLYSTILDWLVLYRNHSERFGDIVINAKNFRRTWKDATREFLEFVVPRIRPDLIGRLRSRSSARLLRHGLRRSLKLRMKMSQ